MSTGRYSFLPWLRRGIANQISTGAASANRASLTVTFNVTGGDSPEPVSKSLDVTGPGDILGINPQQIIRMHPRPWITDFEPNYFVFVEFYDEDFPWRYTPAPVDGSTHRLAPWLSLFVLAEGEFERSRGPGQSLFSVRVKGEVDFTTFVPPETQLYAWAHTQVSDALGDGTSPDLTRLEEILRDKPEKGVSRLMSPRRLKPNTAYVAFLVPTFEIGRLAGLGEKIEPTLSGLKVAWPTAREYPVYHEWYFRTGDPGDFEDLVRRLKPYVADARIGIRDLDVRAPGFGMGVVDNPPDGLVGLEGAVVAPTAKPRGLDPASNFTENLAPIVNAPTDQIASPIIGGDDPVVAPPLYGRWHALVDRLEPAQAPVNWLARLNADPRYRAAAGLGARVVRKNQETYMREAWKQIGEVLALNEQVNRTQVSMLASEATYVKSIVPLDPVSVVTVASPLLRKVLGSPRTLGALVSESRLTDAAFSGAFRKMMRPRGLVARRAFENRTAGAPMRELVSALNDGRATADPPKPIRADSAWEAGGAGLGSDPNWLQALARVRWPLLFLLLFLLAILLWSLAGTGMVVLGAIAVVGASVAISVFRYLSAVFGRMKGREALAPGKLTSAAVQNAPGPASFGLRQPGETALPVGAVEDGESSASFRKAFSEFAGLLSLSPEPPTPRPALDINSASRKLISAMRPLHAQPRRLLARNRVGERSLGEYVAGYADFDAVSPYKQVVKCMAYPDIKDAMYKPLADLGSRLLAPNIDLVPQNTLSILLVNQRFIEAYLAGACVEFCSELLWREYPTDQRGSTFRQFWDVSTVLTPQGVSEKDRDEALKDIEKIHEWPMRPTASKLGDNRKQTPGRTGDSIVLVIRGDLLKRYPNTIIYAQRARWGAEPSRRNQLVLFDETGAITSADTVHPDIRFPLFKAQIDPDIHFIGFNLSPAEARGAEGLEETAEARTTIPSGELGWFFVLQEVVGEPRFGLDEASASPPQPDKWDNLSWQNLGDVSAIDFTKPFAAEPTGAASPLTWGSNAADMAAIFYQKPVLIAVHARDLIKDLPPGGSPWTD